MMRSLECRTSWTFFWVLRSFGRASELDLPHFWPTANTRVTSSGFNAETKDTAFKNHGAGEKNTYSGSLDLLPWEELKSSSVVQREGAKCPVHLQKSPQEVILLEVLLSGGRRRGIKVHKSSAIFLRFASTLNLTLSGFWVFLRTKSIFKGEMCCHWEFSVVFTWLRQQRQSKNCFCLQENRKFFCPKFLLQNRKLIIN